MASVWPKLMRDVDGLVVRSKQPMSNALASLPLGTKGTLEVLSSQRIHFHSERCECCGVAVTISGYTWSSVKVYFDPAD